MRRSHRHFHSDKAQRYTNKSQSSKGLYVHLGHFEGIFEKGVVREVRVRNTKKGPIK